MNTQITYYQKRNFLGQFKSVSYKKLSWSIIKKQLIILSILMNIVLARQQYNIRCVVNGQIVGYFTTKTQCGNLNDQFFASTQLNQTQNQLQELTQNSDLINQ